MPGFISASVSPIFDTPHALGRRRAPDAFLWNDEQHTVSEMLAFWSERGQAWWQRKQWRGRRQHVSSLGRDYYRVRTAQGRIFDLYYDRRLQGRQMDGQWILWREWQPHELEDADNLSPDAL